MSETGKNPEDDFDFEAYDETGDFEYDPDMDMSNVDFDDLPTEEGDMPPLEDDSAMDAGMSDDVYDVGTGDDGEMSDAAPMPQKKKSSAIFYLVLALVVLGGGFFIFSTFMSGPAIPPRPTPTPMQTADNGMGMPQDPAQGNLPPLGDMQNNQQQPVDTGYPAPSDMGQLPDANQVPQDTQQQPDMLGMGADPMAQTNDFAPGDQPVDQQQFQPDMAQNDTPALMMDNAQPAPAVPTPDVQAQAQMQDTGAIAPPAPSANQSDTQLNNQILSALNGIQEGIGQLRQSMNSLEVRVTALENAPAPEAPQVVQGNTGANPAEIAALKKDIGSVESKMSGLEEAMATQSAAVKEALTIMKQAKTQMAQAAKAAPAPAPVAKPQPKTVTAAPTPAPVKAAPTPTPTQVSWKLQGAQPGKAWLTRSTGGEPVTVMTGAYLPGLGQVNFIGQRNGRWMVEGTQGSVSE